MFYIQKRNDFLSRLSPIITFVRKRSYNKASLIFALMLIGGMFIKTFAQAGGDVMHNKPGMTLEETFNLYVQTVQNSDLEGLFSTITDDEHFIFLTAGGKLIDSRQGYYEFHREWFRETDWEMPVEIVDIHKGNNCGYVTAIFYFRSKLPDGGRYLLDSYFTLIFRKSDDMWKVIADICTPIVRQFEDADSNIKYNFEQNYLFDIMKTRRTVRKFKPASVPEEHIRKILNAARYAPTAGNQQPWTFLVVQDIDRISRLKSEALEWYLESYKKYSNRDEKNLDSVRANLVSTLEDVLSAPVYVAVLVDTKVEHPDYIIHDGALAAGQLMIAARALGYGTGFYTTYFPEDKMKGFFNIPENYKLICFTPVGIPDEWPEMPEKKNIDDLIVYEKFD